MERGQRVPAFELPDQDGKRWRVEDLAGPKGLVLHVYPKDDTPGCTVEAQDFRDLLADFRKLSYEVAGAAGPRRQPASEPRYLRRL
jgi:peroxiredoxin Q/BCP